MDLTFLVRMVFRIDSLTTAESRRVSSRADPRIVMKTWPKANLLISDRSSRPGIMRLSFPLGSTVRFLNLL